MNRFACRLTSAKNCCATSEVNSRSRLFENTEWVHSMSSMLRLPNYRTRRLQSVGSTSSRFRTPRIEHLQQQSPQNVLPRYRWTT